MRKLDLIGYLGSALLLSACSGLGLPGPDQDDIRAGQAAAAKVVSAYKADDEAATISALKDVDNWTLNAAVSTASTAGARAKLDVFRASLQEQDFNPAAINQADGLCRGAILKRLVKSGAVKMEPSQLQALAAPCAAKADPAGEAATDYCAAKNAVAGLRVQLDQQKRIEIASGVADLDARRRIGSAIVTNEDLMKAALARFQTAKPGQRPEDHYNCSSLK